VKEKGEGSNEKEDKAPGARGTIVVKALCYKPKSCGFNFRLDEFFQFQLILLATLGPGVYSESNRNEYQK
jgi:hypothetical protein